MKKKLGRPRTGSVKETPGYSSWDKMHQRCSNEKHDAYPYYGGRGIRVCARWKNFRNFLADMGKKPDNHSLDRIDNDGNYEPSNCRWLLLSKQSAHRRFTKFIHDEHGNRVPLTEFARAHAMKRNTVLYRYEHGLPLLGEDRRRKNT